MSDDFGFAPPPFKADEALQRLKRDLRELGLSEREGVFERRGVAVARARLVWTRSWSCNAAPAPMLRRTLLSKHLFSGSGGT